MTNHLEALREQLRQYFWPHPYPESHPPIQVTFSNGLPESDNDPIHKVFVIPYAMFEQAVSATLEAAKLEARIETANYFKKYMISNSPFIDEIVDPYIDEQRARLRELVGGSE